MILKMCQFHPYLTTTPLKKEISESQLDFFLVKYVNKCLILFKLADRR